MPLGDLGSRTGLSSTPITNMRQRMVHKGQATEGGNMEGEKQHTRRLHLFTNPKQPDVFMGMTDVAALTPAPRAETYLETSSYLKVLRGEAEMPLRTST